MMLSLVDEVIAEVDVGYEKDGEAEIETEESS